MSDDIINNMKSKSTMKRDVQFLYEMGAIRYVNRTWRRFLSPNVANLAEHHFRVFWIAMIIAEKEGNIDMGKIARMVMVHDIAESRTGDVDYLSRQYAKRNEELGIIDILENTALKEEFVALWREYEERQTPEARVVKDADTLDVDLELKEQGVMGNKGVGASHFWREEKVKPKLYTETARKMFDEIQISNPHSWHMEARNRSTHGDWNDPSIKA